VQQTIRLGDPQSHRRPTGFDIFPPARTAADERALLRFSHIATGEAIA